MEPKVKIALVGCGAAAERYYIPALKKKPEIQGNLFVVDRDRARAQNVIDQIGTGQFIEDYKSILGEVQGAIIALPNALHHPVGLDFLRSKAALLCEKPLADNHGQAMEMVAAAEENAVALCVNNTRRMFPSNQAICKALADRRYGAVKAIQIGRAHV
jgi:predicted dehydrogenase